MKAIPIGFITHIPLRLTHDLNWGTFLLLLGVIAAYCVLAFALYTGGFKRYESGNLIITRM